MSAEVPAEVFPPGEFIRDEIEARGWTQADLAEITGKNVRLINEIINARRSITPDTAGALADAFGTSIQFWLNLEASWQARNVQAVPERSRKAILYGRFPVADMVKRGWVIASDNMDTMEQRFMDFFGIGALNENPRFVHAAKKRDYDSPVSFRQYAWIARAFELAPAVHAERFSEKHSVKALIPELQQLLPYVDGVREVPRVLSDHGVRLVVIEALPGMKMTAACGWIDGGRSPFVALTMMYDRVDNFWHTLFHELDHIAHGEGKGDSPVLEIDDADVAGRPPNERRADAKAAEDLVQASELDGFIARVGPLYSAETIIGFARRMNVHPGIVVGQLRNRGLLGWNVHTKLVEKVRSTLIQNALTDGFGYVVSLR